MTTDTDVVTYAGIAQWLPRAVVEAIEEARPCPSPLNDGRHFWRHQQVMTGAGYVARETYWCGACGISRATRPDSY